MEQLIEQLTRIEEKLEKLNKGEDLVKHETLEFNKPDRATDMTDEQYERWVKDCELRSWYNSLSKEQLDYLNSHVKMKNITILNQRIGPITAENTLLLQDYF